MNGQKKIGKKDTATHSGDTERRDRTQGNGSGGGGSRCVLCREVIHHGATLRTITSGKRRFAVHAACLDHLHGLLHQAFDSPLPTPTLTRSLTLGEFLLTKRPRSDEEILACIVYHHHAQTSQLVTLTVAFIDEQLCYTGFKVRDFDVALKHAVDRLAYLEAHSDTGKTLHRLTAKGTHLVEHLPAIAD